VGKEKITANQNVKFKKYKVRITNISAVSIIILSNRTYVKLTPL